MLGQDTESGRETLLGDRSRKRLIKQLQNGTFKVFILVPILYLSEYGEYFIKSECKMYSKREVISIYAYQNLTFISMFGGLPSIYILCISHYI